MFYQGSVMGLVQNKMETMLKPRLSYLLIVKGWVGLLFGSNCQSGSVNVQQVKYLLIMSHHAIRYIANQGDKDLPSQNFYAKKGRDTYISANQNLRGSGSKESKPYTTSPTRFGKQDNNQNQELLPPRAAPFQRSRNVSMERRDNERSQVQSSEKGKDEDRREVLRFSQLKKKLDEEMQERQRLQEVSACQELKLVNLTEEINKLRVEKKQFERVVLQLQRNAEVTTLNLTKANQKIEELTRNLKEARLNQKSLTNLKNLQNQIEYLQERNKKLIEDNKELAKSITTLKGDLEKQSKESQDSSECSITKAIEGEIKQVGSSERELFLERSLHDLEKKLYEKESQMKKLLIQLNCIDRKKMLSINQMKTRKDQEIKDLRQKFIKVTKDLKDTKDKFEKNEKKKSSLKDNAFLRKVKSSKNIGMTSESEEVTFQLSSEA